MTIKRKSAFFKLRRRFGVQIICVAVLIAVALCGCEEKESPAESDVDDAGVIVYSTPINVEVQAPKLEASLIEVETDVTEDAENAEEAGDGEEDGDIDGSVNEAENADEESPEDLTEEAVEQTPEEPPVSEPVNVTPGSVQSIPFNPGWRYAEFSAINSGSAVLYTAADNRRNIVIGVNAGHGTKGGNSVKTYCHPDMTPKVTGGSTASGSVKATAVSSGMAFYDGTSEASVTLREAQILRDKLLAEGFDVLMVRDGDDVQLDNVARTVMCNNMANCHIALHWDGDNLDYDKGCFYSSVPEEIKNMEPVSLIWPESERLGQSLIAGLQSKGAKIHGKGSSAIDLTQTSYSSVPSVDIELGNAASAHDDVSLSLLADGLVSGIEMFF